MKELDSIGKIKQLNPQWKLSQILIKSVNTWMIDTYYILINFTYKGVNYDYREDASTAWIERC